MLLSMAPVPSPGYLERFRSALISEIKAEMGRRDLTNSGLASLIGESKQYVGSRLGSGNPHTKKRVEINVSDLYVIAGALELDPRDLLARALPEATVTSAPTEAGEVPGGEATGSEAG